MCLLIFLSCILIMWISWLNWDPEVWFAWICLFSKIRMRYGVLGRRQWHPTPVLLPGKFHGWRSLEGCSPWGCKESDTTERLPFHFSLSCIGEGNVNPLQCSCLENPRDGGAWWAAIYGVTQSRARLKWLSISSSKQRKGLIDYITDTNSKTAIDFQYWSYSSRNLPLSVFTAGWTIQEIRLRLSGP